MTIKDKNKLSEFLLDDSKKRSEALIWFQKAHEEGEKQNHEKVIELYSKGLELNPKYAIAYYNRGVSYGKLKQYERAIADYDRAIELDPKDADAYYNRGSTIKSSSSMKGL